ncbi:MAG: isoprenylcysteine carboxylmethyltransferase family protein [Acidobacteriia bacterium]|nr:isoprenylcysteine carboxylmethyltransferase family protein [Terriglobia bacterium]
MKLLGTPPINPTMFVIGKVAIFIAWLLPFLQLSGRTIQRTTPGLIPVAAALVVAGVLVWVLAFRALGSSARVGLPTEPTALKTGGIYRFSRNPIYIGMFLFTLAACLYCPYVVVISSSIIGILIHHKIALGEESFLEQRFGEEWRKYKARTPRYIGFLHEG